MAFAALDSCFRRNDCYRGDILLGTFKHSNKTTAQGVLSSENLCFSPLC